MDSRGADLNVKHISLYRKYRPQKFSEIAGQAAAVDMLVSALSTSGVGHAYLFSGPRGCGKTTAARLLAKALNCLDNKNNNNEKNVNVEPCGKCENCVAITEGESLDVVEIDGASNNTVDEARELKSQANLAPFNSRYKIYIIDEVHMLSIAAFNALLKIMEEPPDYIVFILATTEPHKVPVTIRSRCQHIPFHRINVRDIFNQLTKICNPEHENIQAEPEALWEIARQADGGMRDALSMLEQVINTAKINNSAQDLNSVTLKDVELAVGAGSRPELEKWLAGLITLDDDNDDKNKNSENENDENNENIKNFYLEFKNILDACTSPERVFEELFSIGRNLWLASMWPDIIDTLDVSEFENDFLKNYTSKQRSNRADTAHKLKLFLNAALRMIKQSRLDFSVDVLFGMFTLEIDNIINYTPAQNFVTVSEPVQPLNLTAKKPEIKPVVSQKTKPDLFNNFNNLSHEEQAGDFAEDFKEIKALEWKKFADDEDKKVLAAAHDKSFVLYCALLDAELYKCGGKLLLKFDTLHCYETARIERNTFLLEDIINLNSDYEAIYFNFRDIYFEYKIESKSGNDNDKKTSDFGSLSERKYKSNIEDKSFKSFGNKNLDNIDSDENSEEPEKSGVKEPKGVKRYERTIADDFAQILGGQIVMVKSDEISGENYDDDEDENNLNLNGNDENNDENDVGENEN